MRATTYSDNVIGTDNATADNDVCAEEASTTYQIFWITIIVIILICNTFILAAMARSWAIMRHNVVYRYLISCLLSVMSFCMVSAYEMFHTIYHVDESLLNESVLQSYNSTVERHRYIMQTYAYRKGLLPVLAIIMQSNIAALIYGVKDNAYFVGRYADPEIFSETDKVVVNCRIKHFFVKQFLQWKKRKPVFACLLAWIAPLGLSFPVAFGWNCINHCICLPAYRWGSTCVPKEGSLNKCSRTWLPMSQSYVIAVTMLYYTLMAIMLWMLVSTLRKFRRIHHAKPKSRSYFKRSCKKRDASRPKQAFEQRITAGEHSKAVQTLDVPNKFEGRSSSYHGRSSSCTNEISALPRSASMIEIKEGFVSESFPEVSNSIPSVESKLESNNEKMTQRGPPSFYYGRGKRRPLDRNVMLLIVLNMSFCLSVSPVMLIWFLDVVVEKDVSAGFGFSISLSLSYLYAASLPLILLKYMSGLKKACIDFFIKCPCFTTTIVTKSGASNFTHSTPSSTISQKTNSETIRGSVAAENKIFTLDPE